MKLTSSLNPRSEDFQTNKAQMESLIESCADLSARIQEGGGEKSRERHLSRGKLLPRDRVAQLCDPNTPFLDCLLYTSPSPRDLSTSRMPSSA